MLVQTFVGKQIDHTACRAGFGFGRTHKSRARPRACIKADAHMEQGSNVMYTFAVFQTVVLQGFASGSKRIDFSMMADIVVANAGIVCRCDCLALIYNDRANGDFAQCRRLSGLFYRQPHKGFHIALRRENGNRRMVF